MQRFDGGKSHLGQVLDKRDAAATCNPNSCARRRLRDSGTLAALVNRHQNDLQFAQRTLR